MNEKIESTLENSAVLFQKAQALYQLKKYPQANEIITKLIEHSPNDAEYYYFKSEVKREQSAYPEQLKLLMKALELRPNTSEFLVKIGYCHFTLINCSEAVCYAKLAENNVNNSAELYCMIAKLYSKLGLYAESAQVLQKAALLYKDNAKIYYHLGGSLTLCGKIESAVKAFQQSILLEPNDGLTYAGFTKTRKASLENNNIESLKKQARKERNASTGINIYHGLAKELDDLGLYEEAFNALTKGKKRLKSSCAFNPNKGAENIQDLKSLYEKYAQEIQHTHQGSNAAPIFVTGMPRTGTTVVERILTNHPEVITLGERFQLSACLRKQCHEQFSGLIDAKVLNKLWSTIDFEQLGNDYVKSVDYLSNNSHRFVDKLPLNILMAGVILRALPKAKIVCLLRNPLDTIIGNYRQILEQTSGTYAYTLDLHATASFVYEFRQLVKSLQENFPERFMVVEYESLVDAPKTLAKKMFDFCQLSWDESYLDIHKNKAPIGTASAAQVQEPIHKKSLGQSHNYMFCLEEIKKAFEEKEGLSL